MKNKLTTICAAAGLLAAAAPARAQLPEVLVTDTAVDQIVLISDKNGDGDYNDFADDESISFIADPSSSFRDVQVRIEDGKAATYMVDTVNDVVWRAEDMNGDLIIDSGEIAVFYDLGSSSPDSVEVLDDGSVWVSADGFSGSFSGLIRLEDINGNGDAEDPGEAVIMIDELNGPLVLASNDSGTGIVDTTYMNYLAPSGDGVVTFTTGDDICAYRYEDMNGDGDIRDPGEARLFFNPTGARSDLPLQADWGTGPGAALRVLEIPNMTTPSEPYYAWLTKLTTIEVNGVLEYYFACTSSATSAFSTNIHGEGMNGLIYRGVDLNGDNDIQDSGEVNLYYDGSYTSAPLGLAMGKIIGMDGHGDSIYVMDVGGSNNRLYKLTDMNGDGDAMDVGEHDDGIWDLAAYPALTAPFVCSTGSCPSPFVYDIGVAEPGAFGTGNFVTSGVGCSYIAPDFDVPSMGGSGEAIQGASTFVCTLTGGAPSVPTILNIGLASFPQGFTLASLGFPNCNVYIVNRVFKFNTFSDFQGNASRFIPIPTLPALTGFPMPMQWLQVDPIQFTGSLSDLGVVTIIQ